MTDTEVDPLSPEFLERRSLACVTTRSTSKPPKLVIYGVHGIGKTTLAASAPSPIVIPVEDGLASVDKLNVPRFPVPRSYGDVMDFLRALYSEKHDYKSLFLDTADAFEPLIWSHVCETHRKGSIEDFGYGKGYVHATEMWRRFLQACETLRDHRGMTIVLIAHSAVVRVSPPDSDEYDRYSLKLQKAASAIVQEWADAVLFCQYESRLVKTEQNGKTRTRAVGDGSRVMRTTERPAWSAKNRFGLPDDLPLSWEALTTAMKGTP